MPSSQDSKQLPTDEFASDGNLEQKRKQMKQ
jgi:hypothetical protein